MTRPPAEERIDDRLVQLLDVEQRLESRLRAAEAEARARVEAARSELDRATATRRSTDEEAERRLEAEERREHEAQLAAIAERSAARVKGLDAVPAGRIDALARTVVEVCLVSGGKP